MKPDPIPWAEGLLDLHEGLVEATSDIGRPQTIGIIGTVHNPPCGPIGWLAGCPNLPMGPVIMGCVVHGDGIGWVTVWAACGDTLAPTLPTRGLKGLEKQVGWAQGTSKNYTSEPCAIRFHHGAPPGCVTWKEGEPMLCF